MASEEHKKQPPEVSATPAATNSTTTAAAAVVAYGNSEWAASLQAYYGGAAAAAAGAPPGFFPPGAAPSPHPYVWPAQMMSPYGTPIPFSPMYHPGAFYTHPSMGVSVAYPAGEAEGKTTEGKSKGSAGKGSSGTPEKSGDGGKRMTSASEDNASRSGDSGSEGSSDTRDDDADQKDSSATKKRKQGDLFAEGGASQTAALAHYNNSTAESSYNSRGRSASKLPVSAPGRAVLPGSATNRNMGMDIWNASPTGALPMNARPAEVNVASTMAGQDGVVPGQQWDERQLKRERRKQSNRESARRSRLRKQQECEELARRVAELSNENSALKVELDHLKQTCGELEAENSQIMEEMIQSHGPGIISDLGINSDSSKKPGVRDNSGHVDNHSNKSNGKFYSGSRNPESTSR
ncbi:DNA-binding protein EMBP-1-like [Typha angustifolia]|uniref:DNA-binding protein EMBP-1-like n=1 Tax=Typha angustifolia TaxID=59011 RepID=UPI003C2C7564